MTETEMSLTVFDPLRHVNADILARDAVQEFDHTTQEGEIALRSWVHRVRGHKGDIERCRIATKDGAAKFIKQVNEVAKELTLEVQTIIDTRMKPLDEIEAQKRAEAEAVIAAEHKEAERVEAERLADLKKREDEIAEKEAAFKAIEAAAERKVQEADRIIREKKIAEDAAEKAKKKAEIDKAEALKKAEREKQEAIDAEKAKAAEIKADLIAEEEKQAAIEAKRVANKAHRDRIETEIHNAFHEQTDDYDMATEILSWILDGKIPHVTINY